MSLPPIDTKLLTSLAVATMLSACVGDLGTTGAADASAGVADADPSAPDADPSAPDANPRAPDAEPGAPDATTTSIDAYQSADASTACDLPAAGTHNLTINIDGQNRAYILYVPAGLSAPAPFVVALHGNGDTAANFLPYSQLGALADTNSFLLALPQAIPDSAPYGVDWDSYTEPASTNKDYRLVEEIRATWSACSDASRVYVLGYSQGGFLAFYIGMKDAGELGAIHVQSAANPMPGSGLISGAARKIPVHLRIGDGDSLLDGARTTRDDLVAAGHTVDYAEIADHGHCCYLASLNPAIWAFFAAHPL